MTFRRAITAAAVSVTAIVAGTTPAHASTTNWTTQDLSAGATTAGGTYSNFSFSEAYAPSNHGVKVNARTPGGSLAAGWTSVPGGFVCRYYSGTLQPMMGNNYSSTFKIYGYVGTLGAQC